MDSPVWLHVAPGQGHIINTKLGFWDQRASLASQREQWALLNAKSQQRGAQHGKVCLLSESSHPGPASLCWRGVTSAHSDLHTINTDWEPTQRNSFLSESTSQSWKHSGRKKSNCFPLSLPEDYPFVSTWSRGDCWPWNQRIASIAGIKLEKNTCYWMPPNGAMQWAMFLAEKKKRQGNRRKEKGAKKCYWSKHTPKDQATVQNFKKNSKLTFWGHEGFITVSLFRLLSAKFPKSKLASHAGNFEVFAQSG